MQKYGIPKPHWDKIISTLCGNNKVTGITLFGSRAKGSYRNGSDIDFALSGKELTTHDIISFSVALDLLDLPWEIDLVIMHTITDVALVEHIERCGIKIW